MRERPSMRPLYTNESTEELLDTSEVRMKEKGKQNYGCHYYR